MIESLDEAEARYRQATAPLQALERELDRLRRAGQWRASCTYQADTTNRVIQGLGALEFTPTFAAQQPDFVAAVRSEKEEKRGSMQVLRVCAQLKNEAEAQRFIQTDNVRQTSRDA